MDIADTYGRSFKSLRVSLINTCNLACVYCASPSHVELSKGQALEYHALATIVKKLVQVAGLKTVRLTGGEPTLYRHLIPFIKEIFTPGLDIKLTSNGYLLGKMLPDLKVAGLTNINISLDATEGNSFSKITNRKNVHKVLDALEQSMTLGMKVKINAVVMKGFNDDQILPLFRFAKERNIRIRFLELMRMGPLYEEGNFGNYFFSEEEILKCISEYYSFMPVRRETSSTAKYWVTEDGFRFGIIANESSPFCHDCNRLRLDSYGNIYGCLSNETGIPIAESIHDESILEAKLRLALSYKQAVKFSGSKMSMMAIGG